MLTPFHSLQHPPLSQNLQFLRLLLPHLVSLNHQTSSPTPVLLRLRLNRLGHLVLHPVWLLLLLPDLPLPPSFSQAIVPSLLPLPHSVTNPTNLRPTLVVVPPNPNVQPPNPHPGLELTLRPNLELQLRISRPLLQLLLVL